MALADDLIGYWAMDEASGNALDSHSVGPYDAVETSGTIASASGKVGGARDFEAGDTEYFTIADNADLSTGDITFSWLFWVFLESTTSFPTPVSKDAGSPNREYGFYLSSGTPRFYVSATGTTVNEVAWGSSLSTATWYMIAGGHNHTTNERWISVDGGTPVTASHTTGVFDSTAPVEFGHAAGGGSVYLDGLLDEVGFWKRDIRADLSELYNAGAGRDYAYITGGGGGGNAVGIVGGGVGSGSAFVIGA